MTEQFDFTLSCRILSFAYVTALPNIPSASVVAVVTILGSIGVNEKGASLLYAVEFIK